MPGHTSPDDDDNRAGSGGLMQLGIGPEAPMFASGESCVLISAAGQPALQQQTPTDSTNRPVYCQVLGCQEELIKSYCIKKRACTAHLQAEAVQLSAEDTNLWRFCQQCGKFEVLGKFDDNKRSCRARLAKRRSGTRAQLLKKVSSTRTSTEERPGLDQLDSVVAAADVTRDRPGRLFYEGNSPLVPALQLPASAPLLTADINTASATHQDAVQYSHQCLQQQRISGTQGIDLGALLPEAEAAETSATVGTLPMLVGGHAFHTAPKTDMSAHALPGSGSTVAVTSSAAVRLGTKEQAALSQMLELLEDSEVDEEGNLDAIFLQEDVVAALQQELLDHNWQQPQQQSAVVPLHQVRRSLMPVGGRNSSSRSGFMSLLPGGSGNSCRDLHMARVPAAATAGLGDEAEQCCYTTTQTRQHAPRPDLTANLTPAFTAASGVAWTPHLNGLSHVAADLFKLQSGASFNHVGNSADTTAHGGVKHVSHTAAAATALPTLKFIQQEMTSGNFNDLAYSRGGGCSSRLQWLMDQLQQELQQCSEEDLHGLEDEELNMLLMTALTPPGEVAGQSAPAAAASAADSMVTAATTQAGSAIRDQGYHLAMCSGHQQQQKPQGWGQPGPKAAAVWPCQTSPGPMLQLRNPTATNILAASTAMTVPPSTLSRDNGPSALAAAAAFDDDVLLFDQQQPQQQVLTPNLSGSLQGNASGLSGRFYDCMGPASLGGPDSMQGYSLRPAVACQGVSAQAAGHHPGGPHLGDCQPTASFNQQESVQLPGWWQQQYPQTMDLQELVY